MAQRMTEVLSFRASPEIKALLRDASAHERRTLTNMLEVMIVDYCKRTQIRGAEPAGSPPKTKTTKRK